jgi:PPM family protein phosphatase
VAHVGDSRCYRFRGGRLERLTEDHTFANELDRQGRLPGGPLRELGGMLTRSLGEGPAVQPDARREEARPGDLLLLCTDGLTASLGDAEIAAVLAERGDLRDLAAELIERAGEKGAANDTTVVLLRWPGGPGR